MKSNNIESLYPFKFSPILKSVIWGGSQISQFKNIKPVKEGIGESWEISGVKENISVVSNGKLAGTPLNKLLETHKEQLVGTKIYQQFGNTFPLLLKFIDAQDNLSIQVHPDDKLAMERHNSYGKTEMWYVVSASPDAFLYTGFEKSITPEQYEEMVHNNTFTETLKKYKVKEGDLFYLPAGRVHAIGSGCFIAEIQQTSNITYRIYDYNRKDAEGNPRELHTELAKEAIDFTVQDTYKTEYETSINQPVELIKSPFFTTKLLEIDTPLTRDYSQTDSFVTYMCISGHCTIKDDKENSIILSKGETALIPAETEKIILTPGESSKILETFI